MLLAYKYVGLAVLLAEANFNAERLNLPVQRPIQESQLTFKFIFSTNTLVLGGFAGRVTPGSTPLVREAGGVTAPSSNWTRSGGCRRQSKMRYCRTKNR